MANKQELCEKYGVTESRYDEYMTVFQKFDTDGNGSIDSEEIKKMMSQLDVEQGDNSIEEMVKEADKNGDGEVDFEEFLQLLLVIERESDLQATFNRFDLDGNGFIDREELTKVFSELSGRSPSEQELDEMFKEADTNGDGQIDFNEFKFMMLG